MKIKIVKSDNPANWYHTRIGEEFEFENHSKLGCTVKVGSWYGQVRTGDYTLSSGVITNSDPGDENDYVQ